MQNMENMKQIHVMSSHFGYIQCDRMVCLKLTVGQHIVKTDMYLMFDKVWNGEYNEYAVDSRIIGVETLYSIEYTC